MVVLVSRFLPGSRLPTCLAAGILRTSLLKFCLYFALAVAIWTPAFVGLNALLGREAVERFGGRLPGGLLAAALALALLIFGVRTFVLPLFTWRGRRLWRGRLLRIRHWEFWPMWAFYPPLVLYVLWLGLRRGRLTAFTTINPSMPWAASSGSRRATSWTGWRASAMRCRPGDDYRQAVQMSASRRCGGSWSTRTWTTPPSSKPDTGERGRGVAVARSEADAAAFFEAAPGPALVQEYVAGEEYGVFWARYPGRSNGHVFSITHKLRPTVTGDGQSTLQRLILLDRRAVAIAHIYAREHPEAAKRVPAAGEVVELTEVGAHSAAPSSWTRTISTQGNSEQAMNEISTAYDGFDFGRFDVRLQAPRPSSAATASGYSK